MRSVHVLLSTSDADSAAAITAELEAAGHTVTIWEPGTPVPAEARLAIVDGLEQAVLAHDAPCDLVVLVELAEVPLFPELPRQLTDFVITPVRAGELLARVGHLATQPTLAERARQAVFALAVEASSDVVELTRPGPEGMVCGTSVLVWVVQTPGATGRGNTTTDIR